MGALTSRQNAGVEEVDIVSNHAYKYPPKSGNYFGNHFIMGGEKFDTPQPEAYLFGENADLNFLGSRPTPFPYPPPQANEPTKTLKSLVNIRKESLRLVRALDDGGRGKSDSIKAPCFNIEFTFDCDARTAITIYYFAQEEITPNGVVYVTKEPSHSSETFYYKRGTGQLFSQPSHVFDPSQYTDEQLSYNPDRDIIPIAIHCVAQEGTDELRQSHTCIAVVDRHSDGSYVLKTLKQKLFVDGLCYLLQEIYGIENKTNELIKGGSDDDTQDNGSECVICICEVRDTLILPCRHLCLCNSCADSLRYQASSCPICRAPFRALLQIRALQKATQGQGPPQQLPTPEGSCENIPAGYEAVSLIEALNGPCQRTTVEQPTDASDHDASMHQAADVLNRSSLERIPKVKLVGSPEVYESEGACPTPEFRMSVLLSRGADSAGSGKARNNDVIVQSAKASSPLLVTSSQGGRGVGGGRVTSSLAGKPTKQGPRDTVRVVNETSNSHDETDDVDSEAEKLSPLLTSVVVGVGGTDVGGGRRPPDDTEEEEEEEEDDTEEEVQPSPPTTAAAAAATLMPQQGVGGGGGGDGLVGITAAAGGGGEDSDYYTPEDPATTILSPLHTDKDRLPVGGATRPPWGGVSLPGTQQKILEIKDRLPHLKKIIQYSGKVETPDVLSWEDVLKIGNEQSDDQLNEVLKKIGVNECCTLVYTSGTEGKPKAVMLSHDNLTYDAASLTKHLKVDCNNVEILISYLPLSHVAAQVTDIYCPITVAAKVFFADKDALKGSLGQTLAETHPTIFLGVPRVWEKIQEKMLALGKQVSSVKRTLASWAKMSALQHHEAALKGHTSESYRFKLYKWLVFDKIKARMGLGQCKAFISAAAPISDDVKRYFMSLDILIIEAFGMSECAGAHTCGDYNKFSLKGVGVTLPGCSTKLDNIKDGEGEICMSGRHVFMGYLGQPDKTKDTIDEGGWLHSGDVGRLDDKGNLFITGRIKEILITAGGENIAPVPIEDTVKHELPVVSNALLIGDKRKFLSILLSLKTEVDEEGKPVDKLTRDVQDWCQDLGAPSQTVSEILADADKLEKVKKALHEGLKRANAKSISRAQHIQKLAILPQDFAVGDELGPTLKVKRPVVYNKYAEIIEEFYKE